MMKRHIKPVSTPIEERKLVSKEEIRSRKNDSAIQTQINAIQGVISRMASNSSNCKTWAVTVISAILVLLVDKNLSAYYYIAYVPLLIFWVLDCYYLGMERIFRKQYNGFVNSLEIEEFDYSSVFKIHSSNKKYEKLLETIKGFLSFSTSPVYIILALVIFLVSGKC
jgi:hypothetical protein